MLKYKYNDGIFNVYEDTADGSTWLDFITETAVLKGVTRSGSCKVIKPNKNRTLRAVENLAEKSSKKY